MMKKLLILLILMIPVKALADLTGTEGLAIDLSSAGAGTDFTIDFDPTELLGNRTWGDASTDTIIWTWNRATGTDPTITFGNDLFTFGNSLTIVTGKNITLGTTQWNSADEVDGTKIKDADYGDVDVSVGGAWTLDTDSVADNEIDYSNVTFADFDFETNWKMWHSDGAGDVTEITLGANGTFLESNGAAAAPAFRVLADGDVPDNITIDLATLATTVTVSDDEATNDDQEIVFTTDNTNLESDGDFHYSPDTGTVTATEFVGGGASLTGTLTAYDDIADPDAASSITFQDGETVTWATEEDSAGSFFLIQNSDAALAANTYLLDLDYSVDDNEANADYFRCQDAGGVVFSIQENGDTVSTGNIQGATLTEGANAVPNATDHLGFFGGTTSAQLLAEISNETGSGVLVFATAPVFTTSIQLTGANADPAAAAGTVVYDNTIAVMSGGAIRWYDNDSVRLLVDLETDPSNDDYVVTYDAAADGFYMSAAGTGNMNTATYDAGVSGGVDQITTVDSTYASDYVVLTGTAVGTDAPKTDGALTYDATSGTLGSTEFVGGGVGLTGVTSSVLYHLIGDPTAAGSIGFDDGETATYTGANDGAISFFTIQNSDADHTGGNMYLLDLDYSADDGDVDADFIKFQDSGSVVMTIQQDGEIATDGGITAGGTVEGATLTEGGVAVINATEGGAWTGNQDFGGADLELPQASPAVPDADGEIEVDFTDGTVVIQHGAAHAELGGATDVVVGKLIHSFSATLAFPDSLQGETDYWPLKSIRASEFPHGIVVTEVYLLTSASSTYAVNVENWDDFDTINAGDPTIDAITTSATTEVTEDAITYSTIAAGQIIMLDLDTDDIGWIYVEVQWYEPAA